MLEYLFLIHEVKRSTDKLCLLFVADNSLMTWADNPNSKKPSVTVTIIKNEFSDIPKPLSKFTRNREKTNTKSMFVTAAQYDNKSSNVNLDKMNQTTNQNH